MMKASKKASEKFNIPYSWFREHCYGLRTSRARGAKDILSPQEEGQLVEWLMQMAEAGHGLTIVALKMKVSEITMTRVIPFRNGIPRGGLDVGMEALAPRIEFAHLRSTGNSTCERGYARKTF
jgi:hypothetical protein